MRGIKRCLDTAIGNACVSHLGLMLARTTAAVRLNVRSLKAEQFAPYLKAIGWKGSTRGLEEVLADAFAFAERINLAIDVGQEVAIPIGLECSTYVHNSARWEKLLKHLVEASACTEEQHRSLQKWWGRESPSLTVAPWPSNLVIEGLLETPDRFGVIDRFLSHIKITWQSGATPKYKSYLGFTHHFLSKPKALEADSIANRFASPVVWRQVAHPTNELERAISGGIDFLLRNRLASGLWLDFPSTGADDPWLAFGTSDEWVSLYVAAVLGSFEREDAKHAASWVWRLLNHRRNAGEGWGYSCISPADADSTVWALRLAEVVDASHSAPALAAGDFLRRHQHQNGGFATYLRDAAIRYFADLLPSELNAWCEPHACVTAAAAHIPALQEDCFRFLRTAQAIDGRWDSYWWIDSEYSTGLATAALAQSRDEADQARVAAAVKWATDRVGAEGGVFSTACNAETPFASAWNLRALLSAPKHSDARDPALRSVQWLLREQHPDGSWLGSAWMRTPPVNSTAPGANVGTILAQDRNANFTTASVLASLRIARGIW